MSCGPGQVAMAFDVASPEAIAWAERNAARLVTGVTDDVRDAIRLFVTRGFEEGIPPARLAQYIRDGIGLTPRDAGAVLNRRLELLAQGLTQEQVDKKVLAYSEKLIQRRALTIARTETMRASNEGQAELWRQAEEKGLLTGTEMKVWITADPCPICEELEGETVGLNDDFSIGSDPPAHPNCRCTIGLVQE